MLLRRCFIGVVLAIVLCLPVAACKPATLSGAAGAVQSLLELRAENSTSVAEYASFVSTSVAETLASDSALRAPGSSPLPGWRQPQSSQVNTSTARVTVEWERSAEHTGWPKVTVFTVNRVDGRWKVVDAVDQQGSKESTKTP